jgi:hypothetical protein
MRLALLALALLASRTAFAADEEADGGTKISYSHRHQVGVHAQLGGGYRVLAMYEGDQDVGFCGQAGKNVCTGTSPVFLEVGLSFGVSRSVELLADFRLGLQEDFRPGGSGADAPRAIAFQPGLKIYIDDEGSLKFFSTLQLTFDFTDFSANGIDEGTDFGVRNVNGLQVDLHKTFGFYLVAGPTIGFVRWLRFEVDGGVGIQARFP